MFSVPLGWVLVALEEPNPGATADLRNAIVAPRAWASLFDWLLIRLLPLIFETKKFGKG